MITAIRQLAGLALLLWVGQVAADPYLLMVRSSQTFPEAMLALQGAITEQGYTISRVQRVDIGLQASGYETDKYRIVFFGKPQQVRELSARHPHMIPYLPLKMTIFAEGEQTIIVTEDMTRLAELATSPELEAIFAQWRTDIQAMLAKLREQ